MRRIVMALATALVVAPLGNVAVTTAATSQEAELPNMPMAPGGWEDKTWTHPDGTRFHYIEMGEGTPVILIHGSGGTAFNWMANGLGYRLAQTNKVYAIDMRGHAQTVGSDGLRQARTPNMDLDVLAFMDAMGIEKAHIGGFSMGGGITANLLARAPERFITAHFGGSGPREADEYADAVPADPEGPAPLDVEARRLYEERQAAEAARAGVNNADEETLSSDPVPERVARPDLDLTQIDIPILAVVGEFDRPYSRTHRLWREAPNFQRVILRNRGHLSSYMAGLTPVLYGDALTNFIASHNP